MSFKITSTLNPRLNTHHELIDAACEANFLELDLRYDMPDPETIGMAPSSKSVGDDTELKAILSTIPETPIDPKRLEKSPHFRTLAHALGAEIIRNSKTWQGHSYEELYLTLTSALSKFEPIEGFDKAGFQSALEQLYFLDHIFEHEIATSSEVLTEAMYQACLEALKLFREPNNIEILTKDAASIKEEIRKILSRCGNVFYLNTFLDSEIIYEIPEKVSEYLEHSDLRERRFFSIQAAIQVRTIWIQATTALAHSLAAQIGALSPLKSIYIPITFKTYKTRHFVIASFMKLESGNISLKLINTGAGSDQHLSASSGSKLYTVPYLEFSEIPLSVLLETDLSGRVNLIGHLIDFNASFNNEIISGHKFGDAETYLYSKLFAYLNKYHVTDSKASSSLVTPQKSGTCVYSSTKVMLRDFTIDESTRQRVLCALKKELIIQTFQDIAAAFHKGNQEACLPHIHFLSYLMQQGLRSIHKDITSYGLISKEHQDAYQTALTASNFLKRHLGAHNPIELRSPFLGASKFLTDLYSQTHTYKIKHREIEDSYSRSSNIQIPWKHHAGIYDETRSFKIDTSSKEALIESLKRLHKLLTSDPSKDPNLENKIALEALILAMPDVSSGFYDDLSGNTAFLNLLFSLQHAIYHSYFSSSYGKALHAKLLGVYHRLAVIEHPDLMADLPVSFLNLEKLGYLKDYKFSSKQEVFQIFAAQQYFKAHNLSLDPASLEQKFLLDKHFEDTLAFNADGTELISKHAFFTLIKRIHEKKPALKTSATDADGTIKFEKVGFGYPMANEDLFDDFLALKFFFHTFLYLSQAPLEMSYGRVRSLCAADLQSSIDQTARTFSFRLPLLPSSAGRVNQLDLPQRALFYSLSRALETGILNLKEEEFDLKSSDFSLFSKVCLALARNPDLTKLNFDDFSLLSQILVFSGQRTAEGLKAFLAELAQSTSFSSAHPMVFLLLERLFNNSSAIDPLSSRFYDLLQAEVEAGSFVTQDLIYHILLTQAEHLRSQFRPNLYSFIANLFAHAAPLMTHARYDLAKVFTVLTSIIQDNPDGSSEMFDLSKILLSVSSEEPVKNQAILEAFLPCLLLIKSKPILHGSLINFHKFLTLKKDLLWDQPFLNKLALKLQPFLPKRFSNLEEVTVNYDKTNDILWLQKTSKPYLGLDLRTCQWLIETDAGNVLFEKERDLFNFQLNGLLQLVAEAAGDKSLSTAYSDGSIFISTPFGLINKKTYALRFYDHLDPLSLKIDWQHSTGYFISKNERGETSLSHLCPSFIKSLPLGYFKEYEVFSSITPTNTSYFLFTNKKLEPLCVIISSKEGSIQAYDCRLKTPIIMIPEDNPFSRFIHPSQMHVKVTHESTDLVTLFDPVKTHGTIDFYHNSELCLSLVKSHDELFLSLDPEYRLIATTCDLIPYSSRGLVFQHVSNPKAPLKIFVQGKLFSKLEFFQQKERSLSNISLADQSLGIVPFEYDGTKLKAKNFKAELYLCYLYAVCFDETNFYERVKTLLPAILYEQSLSNEDLNALRLLSSQLIMLESYSLEKNEIPAHLIEYLTALSSCVTVAKIWKKDRFAYEQASFIKRYFRSSLIDPASRIPLELIARVLTEMTSSSTVGEQEFTKAVRVHLGLFSEPSFTPSSQEKRSFIPKLSQRSLSNQYMFSKLCLPLTSGDGRLEEVSCCLYEMKKSLTLQAALKNLCLDLSLAPIYRQHILNFYAATPELHYNIEPSLALALLPFTLNPSLLEPLRPIVTKDPIELEEFSKAISALIDPINQELTTYFQPVGTNADALTFKKAKSPRQIITQIATRCITRPVLVHSSQVLFDLWRIEPSSGLKAATSITSQELLGAHHSIFIQDVTETIKTKALKIHHAIFRLAKVYSFQFPLGFVAHLELSQLQRRINTLLIQTEKQVLDLAGQPLINIHDPEVSALSLFTKHTYSSSNLSFDELALSVLNQDSFELVPDVWKKPLNKDTITALASHTLMLKQKIGFCLLLKSLNRRLEKGLTLSGDSLLTNKDIQEIKHLLLNPKPLSEMVLEQLVFEHVSGFHLTHRQSEAIDFFISLSSNKAVKEGLRIAQVNMGGGKTSVITPLLSIGLNKGGKIPLFLVHPSQKETFIHDFSLKQYKTFKQRTYEIDLTRQQMTLENLSDLLEKLNLAKSQKVVYVSTPSTIQSFELEYLHTLIAEGAGPKSDLLKQILKVFKDDCEVIIDEFASACNVTHLVNFPLSGALSDYKMVSKDKIEFVRELFLILTSHAVDYRLKLTLNQQMLATKKEYDEALGFAAHLITAKFSHWQTSLGLTAKEINEFIKNPSTAAYLLKRIKPFKDTPDAQNLCLAHFLLVQLLPSLFTRVEGRQFGRSGLSGQEDKIVPYQGVASPSSTEFGFHYETLCYHFMTAIISGITLEQIKNVAKDLFLQASLKARETGIALNLTEEYFLLKTLTGIELTDYEDPKKLNEAFLKLKDEKQRYVFDNILQIEALSAQKYIGFYPKFLSSNPHNMKELASKVYGFTGTPWNHTTYGLKELDAIMLDETCDLQLQQAFRKKPMLSSQLVHAFPSSHPKQMLLGLFEHLSLPVARNLEAMIDVSGLFREYSNYQAALLLTEALAEKGFKKVINVIYFDKDDTSSLSDIPCLLQKDVSTGKLKKTLLKTLTPEHLLEHGLKAGSYFVYFDERHTQGIDIALSTHAVAMVTLDEKTPYHKFVQGLMRMRQFELGQHVLLGASLPVASMHTEAFSSKDTLLKFLKANQDKDLIALNYRSYKQQIHNAARSLVIEHLKTTPYSRALVTQCQDFVLETVDDDCFRLVENTVDKKTFKSALLSYAVELQSKYNLLGLPNKDLLHESLFAILDKIDQDPLITSSTSKDIGLELGFGEMTIQREQHVQNQNILEIDQTLITEARSLNIIHIGPFKEGNEYFPARAVYNHFMAKLDRIRDQNGYVQIRQYADYRNCGTKIPLPEQYMNIFTNLYVSSHVLFIFRGAIESPFSVFKKRINSLFIVLNQSSGTVKPVFIALPESLTKVYIQNLKEEAPLEHGLLVDLNFKALVDNPHEMTIRSLIPDKHALIEALVLNNDPHLLLNYPEDTALWLNDPVHGPMRQRFVKIKMLQSSHLHATTTLVDRMATQEFVRIRLMQSLRIQSSLARLKHDYNKASNKTETANKITVFIDDLSLSQTAFVPKEHMLHLPTTKVLCILDKERLSHLDKAKHLDAMTQAQRACID